MHILYLRTKRGLARQKRAAEHLEAVETFTEKEPAPTRPVLDTAIARAVEIGAVLVIAKAARLVRNATFTGKLLQAVEGQGLQFICLDSPTCNPQTIHILAAVAAADADQKTQRTREAMARLKAEGQPLGSARPGHWKGREHRRGWKKAVPAASKARSERARREYQWLLPEIQARRERGDTLVEIAKYLNDQGHQTTAGMPFTEANLWRIIKRHLGDEYLGNKTRGGSFREVTHESRQAVLEKVIPRIKELREEGQTFQAIAVCLNEEGHRTPRGSNFSQSAVWNLAKKYLEGALQA